MVPNLGDSRDVHHYGIRSTSRSVRFTINAKSESCSLCVEVVLYKGEDSGRHVVDA